MRKSKHKNIIKSSSSERVFDIFNHILLAIIGVVALSPYIHVIAGSMSNKMALINMEVTLWPVGFQADNYMLVFNNQLFWNSFKNTIFITVIGTTVNMVITVMTAYPLSKSYLRGNKVFMTMIVITLVFVAPMIPTYLVVKNLGLLNTLWAMILPSAMTTFNMLLCRSSFKTIPEELFEAARIDGMHEMHILWKIAIPVSIPMIMTLGLFYAVRNWNAYYEALIYITNQQLKPLQAYLYTLISQFSTSGFENADSVMAVQDITPEGLKMATIVVATLPIIMVYPFIQKYFIKGVMLGSVKE